MGTPTAFTQPFNAAFTRLATPHVVASDTLNLEDVSFLPVGVPSATHPIRLTLVRQSDFVTVVFKATARSGNLLSGLSLPEGGVDSTFQQYDAVQCRITKGYFDDIHAAVNALESAGVGSPGHSPVVAFGTSADADRLTVDGVVTGPHLTGPQGATGPSGSTALLPSTANPVLWLRSDGTINSGTSVATLGAAHFAKASTQYVQAPSTSDLQAGTGKFYTCGWFKLDSLPGTYFLWGKGNLISASTFEFQVLAQGTVQFYFTDGTTISHLSHGLTLATGTWYFVEAWYDGSLMHLQVNAASAVTAAWTTGLGVTTRPFVLGADTQESFYHDGLLQSVVFLKRAATAGEQAWLYNSGAGRRSAEAGVQGTGGSDLSFGPNSGEWWDLTDTTGDRLAGFNGNTLQVPTNVSGDVVTGLIPTYSAAGLFSATPAPSSPVLGITDMSGAGANFIGGTTSSPVLKSRVFGNAPSLQFNGISDNLQSGMSIDRDRGTCVSLVVRPSNVLSRRSVLFRLRTNVLSGSDFYVALGKSGGNTIGGGSPHVGFALKANGQVTAATGCFLNDLSAGSIVTVNYRGGTQNDPTNYRIYRNNNPLTLSASTQALTAAQGFSLIGSDVGLANIFGGWIPEIVVTDHALALSDLTSIWGKWKAKYGLSGFAGSDPTDDFATVSTKPQVLCDGDSLTSGFGLSDSTTQSYPAQLGALLGSGWDTYNVGHGGDTTEAMIARSNVSRSYFGYRRTKNVCIAWEAINSLVNTGDTPEMAYAAMTRYVKSMQYHGFKVVLVGSTSASSAAAGAGYATARASYDTLVTANSAGADATFLPSSVAFLEDSTNTTYRQADTIHYTTAGYALLATLLQSIVLSL